MALTGLTMAEGFRDQGNDVLIKGGEMDIFSLGLTWWLSDIFGMNANYRYIWNERNGLSGESSAITLRMMMVLL